MENSKIALLVMDMQSGILNRMPEQSGEITEKIATAIKTARKKNLLVIFVRLGFRNGFPEVNANNKMLNALKENMNDEDLEMFMKIYPYLDVTDNDLIIDKKRISAFSGNDLEMILRAKNISQLVFTGIATSGVILSTFYEALDKDYDLTILSDGCADPNKQIHEFLIKNILPKHSQVITVNEWINKSRL